MNTLTQNATGNVALGAKLAERMAEVAKHAVKQNTVDAYRSDWAMWSAFAQHMGITAMPAAAEHVAAFITACSDGLVFEKNAARDVLTHGEISPARVRKMATLKRYVNTISSMHTRAGETFERDNRVLREIMRGLRQQKTSQQKRAKPLTAVMALDVVAAMANDTRGLRDAALLLLGVVTGMRRSELAGLSLNELADGDGILSIETDGVLIELFRSKTGNGDVQSIFVPNGVAAVAVRDWVDAAELSDGEPIFMRIYENNQIVRARICGHTVARIVKKRVAAAGIDANSFSGHSMRAGLVTSARDAGASNYEIKRVTRHKSDAMLDIYTREIDVRSNKLAKKIGLADG